MHPQAHLILAHICLPSAQQHPPAANQVRHCLERHLVKQRLATSSHTSSASRAAAAAAGTHMHAQQAAQY
jgi:prephenate dehydratase